LPLPSTTGFKAYFLEVEDPKRAPPLVGELSMSAPKNNCIPNSGELALAARRARNATGANLLF